MTSHYTIICILQTLYCCWWRILAELNSYPEANTCMFPKFDDLLAVDCMAVCHCKYYSQGLVVEAVDFKVTF